MELTQFARKLPGRALVGKIHGRIWTVRGRRQMAARWQAWLRQQQSLNSRIDASLQFTGAPNPYAQMQWGADCLVEPNVTVWISPDTGANARLEIGHRVFIGRNTYLGVYQPLSIGANALIGAYCYIITANHCFERRDIPIRDQGYTGAPIIIEEDAWLGTHVVVLPGVTIGRGAIVAGGSVVNKNIPPYEIWGGVPAKFLKQRP